MDGIAAEGAEVIMNGGDGGDGSGQEEVAMGWVERRLGEMEKKEKYF